MHACHAQCNRNQEISRRSLVELLDWSYFKPKDGLPNPKGPLSLSIQLQVIVKLPPKATTDKSKKRGPYFLINVVALNTAGSFKLFHDDKLVHI